MSKIPKRVFLKFNGQEHVPPKLKINLDLATFEGSKPLPWEPVTVEFLDQQKSVSTEENGLKMNVELEFLHVHEEVKAKLKAWINNTESEEDREIAEYDVLLPGAADKIEGAEQEINNLRQENTKLDEQLNTVEREVGQLKLETKKQENLEEQAEKEAELEYKLLKAKEILEESASYLASQKCNASNLDQKKKDLEEKLNSKAEAVKEKAKDLAILSKKIDELTIERSRWEKEFIDATKQWRKASCRHPYAEIRRNESERKKEKLDKELPVLESEKSRITEVINDYEKFQLEFKKIKNDLEITKENLNKAEKAREEAWIKVATLKKILKIED